jgi:hypothetical protein
VHNGLRDKIPWKNDSCTRGKHANGLVLLLYFAVMLFIFILLIKRLSRDCTVLTPTVLCFASETSNARSPGPLAYRLTPLPNSVTKSLSPPPLSSANSSGSTVNTLNNMYFSMVYPQPSPLPRPTVKEAINLFSH